MALACAAAVLAAALPYVQTLRSYFLGDDFGLIWAFHNQAPFYFVSLFTRSWDAGVYGDVPDEIRPLIALSYQVDFALGGGQPFAFHLSNIAYHVINALLVLALARVGGRLSWTAAAVAAACFATLPTHAETVAWISGRADSIPALFYLASLVGFATWRRSGRAIAYAAAVVCCFLALFSKQNAITLPLSVIAFDFIVERKLPRPTWRYVLPYVPFVSLTLGYLGLRYVLFGNVVREHVMAPAALAAGLVDTIANQFEILFLGYFALDDLPTDARVLVRGLVAGAVVLAVAPALLAIRRASPARYTDPSVTARLVYFGPVWWLINVAPLVVTYATSRHLYLPTVGLAVVVGILFDVVCQRAGTYQLPARVVVATAAIGLFVLGLLGPIGEWTASAAISERIARETRDAARDAAPGSLIVVGAPRTADIAPPSVSPRVLHDISPIPGQPWLWSFATPYALQAPFVADELTSHVSFVGPLLIDCCGPHEWYDRTIASIDAWAGRAEPRPVVVLTWHPTTGALVRYSDTDAPCLRSRARALAAAYGPEVLDRGIGTLVGDVARNQPCTG